MTVKYAEPLDLSNAAASQIKYAPGGNPSADPNTYDGYEEYDGASAACTGAITTAATWKLTKSGRLVTLTLPAVSGTATAVTTFSFGTLVPAAYRPAATVTQLIVVTSNGVDQVAPGMARVLTSGEIRVHKALDSSSSFTNAAVAGSPYVISMSWHI